MSSIVPQGVFHTAMVDTKFHGYDIPKGTWITPNQHYFHHSKDIWDEPEIFSPERHLTANGTGIMRNEALMPFSTGNRMCLGSTLALDFRHIFPFSDCHLPKIRGSSSSVKPRGYTGYQNRIPTKSPNDFDVIVKERLSN